MDVELLCKLRDKRVVGSSSVRRFDEDAVREIFEGIDVLATASGWMDEVVGGPITYRFRLILERLSELLEAFDHAVPRWRQVDYLRKYLSPEAAELIRAAQELQELQAEAEVRAAEAELRALEEQQRPLVFYGLSVPLPF